MHGILGSKSSHGGLAGSALTGRCRICRKAMLLRRGDSSNIMRLRFTLLFVITVVLRMPTITRSVPLPPLESLSTITTATTNRRRRHGVVDVLKLLVVIHRCCCCCCSCFCDLVGRRRRPSTIISSKVNNEKICTKNAKKTGITATRARPMHTERNRQTAQLEHAPPPLTSTDLNFMAVTVTQVSMAIGRRFQDDHHFVMGLGIQGFWGFRIQH